MVDKPAGISGSSVDTIYPLHGVRAVRKKEDKEGATSERRQRRRVKSETPHEEDIAQKPEEKKGKIDILA